MNIGNNSTVGVIISFMTFCAFILKYNSGSQFPSRCLTQDAIFITDSSECFTLQTVVGDYNVTVRLLEYNRDQDCACDWGLGCKECDVYFQICLQPLSPTQG